MPNSAPFVHLPKSQCYTDIVNNKQQCKKSKAIFFFHKPKNYNAYCAKNTWSGVREVKRSMGITPCKGYISPGTGILVKPPVYQYVCHMSFYISREPLLQLK